MGEMGSEQTKVEKKEEEKKGGDGVVLTVVLNVKLHCEGCADKVKKTLNHFNGVESVKADHKTNKLTVTGKVEPEAVKERVEVITKKKVELLSPKGGHVGPKSYEKSEIKKPEIKKPDEPIKAQENKTKDIKGQVTTVVLKTRVHCDGCAHKINKILHKYQGVEEARVDLAKDQITIKGTMELKEMLPYLNLKLKRVVEINQGGPNVGEPLKGKEVAKPIDVDGGDGGEKKGKEDTKSIAIGGGGSDDKKVVDAKPKPVEENVISKIEVVSKMDYSGYLNGYGAHTYSYNIEQAPTGNIGFVSEYWHAPPYMHAPAPQIFSDENPNAYCSVM